MWAIETNNLSKTYRGIGGCQEISLAVPRGSIFGLLGPNGAGKSTLVKTLVGLLHPTSGEAKILGKPLNDMEVRKKVGFLPEKFAYHDWLSGKDLLKFHASLYGLKGTAAEKRIIEIIKRVGLHNQEKKKVGSYSKGMQQRIGLGCALVADPELIFMDEPTSALDPVGRKEVRELLVTLKDEGKTVFINSHLLSELETVCDQISIIKESRLIFQGDWREIVKKGNRVKVVTCSQSPVHILENTSEFKLISHRNCELFFECSKEDSVPMLVEYLIQKGFHIYEVTPIIDSLEDMFLQYITNSNNEERR